MLTILNHLENRRLKDRQMNICKCKVDEEQIENKIDLESFSFATKLWVPKMLLQIARNMVKKVTPCCNSQMHDPSQCMYYHGGQITAARPRNCKYRSLCKYRENCRDHHSPEEQNFFQKTLDASLQFRCDSNRYRRLYCSVTDEHNKLSCPFAHNDQEILCYFCFETGHCTMKCSRLLNTKKPACMFGIRCSFRGQCFYLHSPDVTNYFDLTKYYHRWKKNACHRKDQHDPAKCCNAHGSKDALCENCGKLGHFSYRCSFLTQTWKYERLTRLLKSSFRLTIKFIKIFIFNMEDI